MILTTRADKPCHIILSLADLKSFKSGTVCSFFDLLFCQHGSSYSACHIKMWWHGDLFPRDRFKSRNHCWIIGDSSLKEDMISNTLGPYNLLNVILNNGIGQTTHQFVFLCTLLLI